VGGKLWYPPKALVAKEKMKLLKDLVNLIEDVHQRDALVAVLAAYRSYGELLERVKKTLKEKGMAELFEEVASRVLLGKSASVSDAIKDVIKERKRPEEQLAKLRKEYEKLQKLLARREEEIRKLKRYVQRLKSRRLRFL
jgi:predicted RNase H-like nuclease (RuvC/YqgF family)